MSEIMQSRMPWFIAGPVIGLCVVALYALANQRLGVTGSYVQVARAAIGGRVDEKWRLWFFAGLGGGALLLAVLRGGPSPSLAYGALGILLPLGVLIPVLFGAGVLMGFGARWSGGCTSGHGISGNSSFSPASFVATGTFMATAVGLTLLLHWITGGTL